MHTLPAFDLTTETLRTAAWGPTATQIMAAALAAVAPYAAVQRSLAWDGTTLELAGQRYPLPPTRRVLVFATGKASIPMAQAVCDLLGERVHDGVLIYKAGSVATPPVLAPLRCYAAQHPVPDAASVAATQALVQCLAQRTADDLVLLLLSGGSSALLTLPADGLSLSDLQATTTALLRCGASIDAINTIRKHLDQVKGGNLARLAAPAQLVTLIMSDVVGDVLDQIGSGVSVPDSTSFADALAIVERYGLSEQLPASVMHRLRAGAAGVLPENPRADDPLFTRTQAVLVGSNRHAAEAAAQAAAAAGWHALILTTRLQGEAREVGRVLAAIGREVASSATPFVSLPACIIVGGETTVTLRGTGKGGRNQELALGAVRDLAGVPNVALLTLATDGDDGPTDAAGAVVTGATLARAQAAGLDLDAALAHNDAYPFFAALGDLLQPGATGTNVSDLALVLVWPA